MGGYGPLTEYRKDADGNLIGSIKTEKDPVDYRLIKFTDINEIKISAGERDGGGIQCK